MHIVLHNPEIPQNTGNIGRTCVATGSSLHLIEPLGFRLNEKTLKRSGMDYWDELNYFRYINYEDFLEKNQNIKIWFATTKADKTYADVKYESNDFIMFGAESAGIPEEILVENKERCIRIPMAENARSLNLSNSVAIIMYEGLRQQGFVNLNEVGDLHRLTWN